MPAKPPQVAPSPAAKPLAEPIDIKPATNISSTTSKRSDPIVTFYSLRYLAAKGPSWRDPDALFVAAFRALAAAPDVVLTAPLLRTTRDSRQTRPAPCGTCAATRKLRRHVRAWRILLATVGTRQRGCARSPHSRIFCVCQTRRQDGCYKQQQPKWQP